MNQGQRARELILLVPVRHFETFCHDPEHLEASKEHQRKIHAATSPNIDDTMWEKSFEYIDFPTAMGFVHGQSIKMNERGESENN